MGNRLPGHANAADEEDRETVPCQQKQQQQSPRLRTATPTATAIATAIATTKKQREPTLTTLLQSPEPGERHSRVLGFLCLLGFLGSWVASAVSPIFFYLCIKHRFHLGTAFLVLVCLVAYTPSDILWKTSKQDHPVFIFRWFDQFYTRTVTQWFDSVRVVAEDWHADPTKANAERPYFYAVHPHGAFCLGWAVIYARMDTVFPPREKVRFCFAPLLLLSPFFRIFSNFMGYPGSASKQDMIDIMKDNPQRLEQKKEKEKEESQQHTSVPPAKHSLESIALLPGGFEEAGIVKIPTAVAKPQPSRAVCPQSESPPIPPCTERLYLKKRAGFLRLAIKYGYTVRPVFVFGESFCYHNLQGAWSLRFKLNEHMIPTLIPWGWHFMPLMPRTGINLTVVIGAPVDFSHIVPTSTEPSKDQLRDCHDLYVATLLELYDRHKERAYGPELAKSIKLEVW